LQGIDIVFHLVSTTTPQTSNEDPLFDVQSNVLEAIHLLQECVAQSIKKVVFVSSGGTIYGNPDVLPVPEDSPTNPLCSYGISKLTIEKYLQLFYHLHQLDYLIVRPSNPYGPRQNPKNRQGLISVMLDRIARNQEIEIWGDGEVVRDYIYIADLVEAMSLSAFMDSTTRVMNLGSGTGLSINQLIRKVSEVLNVSVRVNYRPARGFDVPAIYLDIARAKAQLSWAPTTALEDGIQKTWAAIQQKKAS
jgi:UDP-glucose 4-epimerase